MRAHGRVYQIFKRKEGGEKESKKKYVKDCIYYVIKLQNQKNTHCIKDTSLSV